METSAWTCSQSEVRTTEVRSKGEGEIIPWRSPLEHVAVEEYVPRPDCFAFFQQNLLWQSCGAEISVQQHLQPITHNDWNLTAVQTALGSMITRLIPVQQVSEQFLNSTSAHFYCHWSLGHIAGLLLACSGFCGSLSLFISRVGKFLPVTGKNRFFLRKKSPGKNSFASAFLPMSIAKKLFLQVYWYYY